VERLLKEMVEATVAVEDLYLSTLSRRPSDEESREAVEYIAKNEDRAVGYSGVLWMLLNRSEFMLIR
jgi:hypothetical protein